ncbi:hypothetical protein AYO41_03500 [Verrucomicrobia bacterium SCGC AG-212-E04]|nr:hypothetical protein AYO41_03500 [Verrucomicrobia bacterium SCGC AG-212-E04]
MKKGTKTVLWIVVAMLAWMAVRSFSDEGSTDPNTRGLAEAIGRVFGTVFAVAAAALALLLWRSKTAVHPRNADENQEGDQHPPMSDDPSVAAKHEPFWKTALGPASVGLFAGLWSFAAAFSGPMFGQVIPLFFLLAGGFYFGRFPRRRPWLASTCLIVPSAFPWLVAIVADGESPGFILVLIGALVAAPLIGVGLALARTRFGPPGPLDLVISERAAVIVAIIGVIISAVISLLFNFGLVPPVAAQGLSLIGTISEAGGLLIYLFALLRAGPGPPDSGKPKKAAIVVAIIGVIISAVILLNLNLRALSPDVAQALFLTSTISKAGGLLIFFFALLRRGRGSPDLGERVRTNIVVAIIGVIISAVIAQILNSELLTQDSMNAPMVRHALSLIRTISSAGGLLIFFFALRRRQEQVGK